MKPRLLLIIDSDPRSSHKPAEAVRIAAGIGAWDTLQLTLYLHGPAVSLLSAESEEFPDGENYARYLPVVRERGHTICVDTRAVSGAETSGCEADCRAIEQSELARLAAGCKWVLRF